MIAFSGSMNESENALSANYETIDVFALGELIKNELLLRRMRFTQFGIILNQNIVVLDFPEIKAEIINRYKRKIGLFCIHLLTTMNY